MQNYTQNIDTLETAAGVQRVLQCHGSFATASCLACRRKVPGKEIETEILRRRVPLCSVCNSVPVTNKTKKKGKKKARGEWDSDDEDESDGPTYPAGIMKVCLGLNVFHWVPHITQNAIANGTLAARHHVLWGEAHRRIWPFLRRRQREGGSFTCNWHLFESCPCGRYIMYSLLIHLPRY